MLVFRRHNFGILVFYLHVYTMYFWAVQISASVLILDDPRNELILLPTSLYTKMAGIQQEEQMIEKSALKYTTKENECFQ